MLTFTCIECHYSYIRVVKSSDSVKKLLFGVGACILISCVTSHMFQCNVTYCTEF